MKHCGFMVIMAFLLLIAASAWAGQVDLLDFGHIENGMTEAEVLLRLGPPDRESFDGYTFENALTKSFYYFSEPERYQNILTVIKFVGGRVVRKERVYRQN